MNILLSIGLAMAFGLLFNRLAKKLGLPNVTGYLVAGLVIGGQCLNLFPFEQVKEAGVLTTVALGFIAFSIGGEFKLSDIRKIGGKVLTITFFQALTAVAFVDIVLVLIGCETGMALTLGAIAAATAPAATLMVVRQYNAKGPVTNMLLPVVALDDAIGLVVFSISLSLAKMLGASEQASVLKMLGEPMIEILGSLGLGAAIGFLLTLCLRFFKSRSNRLTLTICAVLLGTALAEQLNLSSLLLCMMIGAVTANLYGELNVLLDTVDHWTPPLFLLFFVMSGADLDLSILPKMGLVGGAYLIFRSLGKYIGAFVGSAVVKAEPNIKKYLGVALLPQAGVAIGMTQVVGEALPAYADEIRAVVLCATLIYELVGPLMTKLVLTKAGEIVPAVKKS